MKRSSDGTLDGLSIVVADQAARNLEIQAPPGPVAVDHPAEKR